MKKSLALLLAIFCFGCAKVQHIKPLLTLNELGKEGTRLDKYVEQQDKKFALMVDAYKNDTLKEFKDKKSIIKKFGEPIHVRKAGESDQNTERWLYRPAVEFVNSDKIYLYFDGQNKLVDWEYEQAPESDSKDSSEQDIKGGD